MMPSLFCEEYLICNQSRIEQPADIRELSAALDSAQGALLVALGFHQVRLYVEAGVELGPKWRALLGTTS